MILSNIKIKNIKSFKDISIDLNNFNVLIGSCASGKSNFVEIFRFLNDISQDFYKAISMHGVSYLKNFNVIGDNSEPCYLNVSFVNNSDKKYVLPIHSLKHSFNDNDIILIEFKRVEYEVLFDFEDVNSTKILDENVKFDCDFFKVSENDIFSKNFNQNQKLCENSIYFKNNGEFIVGLEKDSEFISIEDIIPNSLVEMVKINLKDENVPIINSTFSTVPIRWNTFFKNISTYNFDPRFCKFGSLNNDQQLSELGDNLAFVLKNIIDDDVKQQKFLNLLHSVLPYVDDIAVEKIFDDRNIFTVIEKYNDVIIPSHLISDGTSNIIAMIVAMYFQKNSCILIEEPERNIHPQLLSDVVQMMNEITKDKQIIITTHNPELLKHIDLKDIFFIFRDENGFSNINKPINNDFLKSFIEELGIDEVFVDNYLELG